MRAPTTSQADLAGGVIDEGFVRFERRSGGRGTPRASASGRRRWAEADALAASAMPPTPQKLAVAGALFRGKVGGVLAVGRDRRAQAKTPGSRK